MHIRSTVLKPWFVDSPNGNGYKEVVGIKVKSYSQAHDLFDFFSFSMKWVLHENTGQQSD